MPKLSDTVTRSNQRILLVGDPGTGKTGAVGHLLEHGYKLFFADFDNQVNVIKSLVPKQYWGNLVYANLFDRVKIGSTMGYPETVGKPTGFRKFIRLTDKWVDDDGTDYGSPETWDDMTWLVTDNVTSMGASILFYTLDLKNKMGQKVSLPMLGDAIRRIEGVCQTLRSYPINTLTLAHLAPVNTDEIEDEDNPKPSAPPMPGESEKMTISSVTKKHYPVTLGRKLPKAFGGYFTTILQTDTVGSGNRVKRIIRTTPSDIVDIKFPVPPNTMPSEVPITDLHKIIEVLKASSIDIPEKAA